ncbi:ABC transporter related [Alkaliphilus metalliredigens QYMF]|uniref:ABC transporter related n=1 Tax=Alkaliphilus metalliredigens (strain QYMF) TaxID=293826 RepID=A6TMG3_ALKMQ|nr:metal ABC transporter ATP-binding protein [Alkaliphilus metalliredigens]ABR47381.1 ABC transporter related [Alkaliphilus metalliredigens QYMF]
MEKVVEVKNIEFAYDRAPVLKDASLEIYQGDFMGIVGPNGSAKSTLLKLLLGLMKPQQGTVSLFGTPIHRFNQWNRIGYISQKVRDFNIGFPATVEEVVGANLYSQMGFLKFIGKKHKEKIREALEIVNMTDYQKRLIGNLSGGQQQRVFIARTLINNPEIIFMDEPLVGVDVDSQDKFYELMEKLNKELGITLVMVSHDIGVITNRANRVACLGNQQVFVHDSKHFNEEKYIRDVYGKKAVLLHHKH